MKKNCTDDCKKKAELCEEKVDDYEKREEVCKETAGGFEEDGEGCEEDANFGSNFTFDKHQIYKPQVLFE